MIFNQPERYPELRKYLSAHEVELTGKERVLMFAVFGVTSIVVSFSSVLVTVVRQSLQWGAVGLCVLSAALGVGLLGHAFRLAKRHEPLVRQESVAARRRLKDAMDSGHLDHAVPVSVALVIEECVTAWRRVQDSLEGPTWKDPGLGPQWTSLRENAAKAADAAMDEVMALASAHLTDPNEAGRIRSLQQLIQRVVGTEELEMRPLPPSFTPALAMADQLRTLALEVESATMRVQQSDGLRENLQASTRISGVLGELRSIQEAEDELKRTN